MTHLALFYADDAQYLNGVRRFLKPGLDAGDPVACAVPSPRLELLQSEFPNGQVEWFDMALLGLNPGRILPAVQGMLDRAGGRRLWYVGEPIWADRSAEEIREATRHEALINLAWPDDVPIHALCPYDVCSLDPRVLVDARRTHPWVMSGDGAVESDAWVGPVVPHACEEPFAPAPGDATVLAFGRLDLTAVRDAVSRCGSDAGLDDAALADFVLAVDEVASNSVVHGGGGGEARVWHSASEVVCEINDTGSIADPLAGRRLAEPTASEGRGLWLAHHLCDLVEVRTGLTGTTVRLHAAAA